MINRVIMVGRLTRDPEVHDTASGVKLVNLRIVTTEYRKAEDGTRKDEVQYHSVVALGRLGEPSYTTTWEKAAAAEPQLVIVMPCGFDAVRAQAEALAHARALVALEAEQVVAVDASAYFSRPGPRLVDGLELLAHILHPRDVAHVPDGARAIAVDVLAAAR